MANQWLRYGFSKLHRTRSMLGLDGASMISWKLSTTRPMPRPRCIRGPIVYLVNSAPNIFGNVWNVVSASRHKQTQTFVLKMPYFYAQLGNAGNLLELDFPKSWPRTSVMSTKTWTSLALLGLGMSKAVPPRIAGSMHGNPRISSQLKSLNIPKGHLLACESGRCYPLVI